MFSWRNKKNITLLPLLSGAMSQCNKGQGEWVHPKEYTILQRKVASLKVKIVKTLLSKEYVPSKVVPNLKGVHFGVKTLGEVLIPT